MYLLARLWWLAIETGRYHELIQLNSFPGDFSAFLPILFLCVLRYPLYIQVFYLYIYIMPKQAKQQQAKQQQAKQQQAKQHTKKTEKLYNTCEKKQCAALTQRNDKLKKKFKKLENAICAPMTDNEDFFNCSNKYYQETGHDQSFKELSECGTKYCQKEKKARAQAYLSKGGTKKKKRLRLSAKKRH